MPEPAAQASIADPPQPPPLHAGVILSGYRLLRPIGGDGSPDTWLAHSDDRAVTVVLAVCCECEPARRRVTAHARISSPHVLALLDVATVADGRILLACEQTDWSLATLLASRSCLAAGEAVTVLAPLAAGLAAVHSAGFAHGRLCAATVLFAADGRPVIGGLEALHGDGVELRDVDGAPRSTPGAISDFRCLGALIRAVAGIVEEQSRTAFTEVADWLDMTIDDAGAHDSLSGQLECRIFALAQPLPLVLVADRRTEVSSPDSLLFRQRAATPQAIAVLKDAVGALPFVGSVIAAMGRVGAGVWLPHVVRRRGLMIGLAAVVAVLVATAGLTAIPDASGPHPSSDPPAGVTAGHGATVPQTAAGSDAATTLTVEEEAAVIGEDAAAAAAVLLELRARCAAVPEPACIPAFAEPGSALDDADRHAFAEAAGGSTLLVAAESRARIELVQAYGDAVLTRAVPADEKRQPVLVLVVRTDTGWRLRDLFEPD